MDIKEAVEHVGSNFIYKKDPKILDYWYVMSPKDGKYYGDCEDFSLTVFWLYSDKNLVKWLFNLLVLHRYRIYFSKTKTGEKHAIGNFGDFWFDNWTRKAMSKQEFLGRTGHKLYFPMPSPLMILPLILGIFYKWKN